MILSKSLRKTKMIRFVWWWDIKTSNIEQYDIQYAAERTNTPYISNYPTKLKDKHEFLPLCTVLSFSKPQKLYDSSLVHQLNT